MQGYAAAGHGWVHRSCSHHNAMGAAACGCGCVVLPVCMHAWPPCDVNSGLSRPDISPDVAAGINVRKGAITDMVTEQVRQIICCADDGWKSDVPLSDQVMAACLDAEMACGAAFMTWPHMCRTINLACWLPSSCVPAGGAAAAGHDISHQPGHRGRAAHPQNRRCGAHAVK